MIELLKLCGYEANEIESDLHRVEKAFDKLGINDEDIERAKQRLNKYYAVELQGVRKMLRLCMRELVNFMLSKEEGKTKFIYGFMVTDYFNVLSYALNAKDKEVYTANQCALLQFILGSVFGKIVPVLEAAEQRWLKAGKVAHCGNVKTLVGLLTLDLIPKPDILVSSGVLCETAPKTLNILHELYDIPVCYYDSCQDREYREYVDATKRMADLLVKTTERLTQRISEVVGYEITDAMINEAYYDRKQLRGVATDLQNLISTSDPLPISANHQNLYMQVSFLALSKERLLETIDAMETLRKELQERVNKGVGVVEKGAPRIVAMLPSHYTDPSLDYMLCEMGLALVGTDTLFRSTDVTGLEKPCEIMAVDGTQLGLHNSLSRRIASITEGCKRLKIDGVLDRIHLGCRTVAADSLIIKDAVTEVLDIPVMLVERDDFDPRVCNKEQYRRQLELFKHVLDGKKQTRPAP
jgi:hypothetical protein